MKKDYLKAFVEEAKKEENGFFVVFGISLMMAVAAIVKVIFY